MALLFRSLVSADYVDCLRNGTQAPKPQRSRIIPFAYYSVFSMYEFL